MLRRLLALIRKELQAQLRDSQSRRLLIMPVILQVALFPFSATLEVRNNTLGVHNLDGGSQSVEIIERLSHTAAFSHVLLLTSEGQVREAIDQQDALLVLQFPADFSRSLAAGRPAHLQTLIDGRRSNAAQVAASYVQAVLDGYAGERGLGPPSVLAGRNWFNENLESRRFLLPSLIAIITTLGCLIVTAMSVAREREQGTFEQLLVSPLTPALIMIGKAVPAILIALVQGSIVLAAAVFVYRIPFQGSLALLYGCIVLYGLALVGVGLLISSMCTTQQQAFLGVFSFIMPAMLLSGFTSPIDNIPEPLRSLTWLNPVRHMVLLARGIYLRGFDAQTVAANAWPLLVIALLTLSIAAVFFQRRSQ